MSSESRYLQCRQASQETPAAYGLTDAFDAEKMRQLGSALVAVGAQITFANFTNVYEYRHKRDDNTFKELPLHPEAVVAYSSTVDYVAEDVYCTPHKPIARYAVGLEAYLQAAHREEHLFYWRSGSDLSLSENLADYEGRP